MWQTSFIGFHAVSSLSLANGLFVWVLISLAKGPFVWILIFKGEMRIKNWILGEWSSVVVFSRIVNIDNIHEVLLHLSMGVTFVSCILVFWPKCVFLRVWGRPEKKCFFLLLLALFSIKACLCVFRDAWGRTYFVNNINLTRKKKTLVYFEHWGKNEYELQEIHFFNYKIVVYL